MNVCSVCEIFFGTFDIEGVKSSGDCRKAMS